MLIKVCGMREPENIRLLSTLPVNRIGLIFYPKSPRYAGSRSDTAEAMRLLPANVKSVGVFVNESLEVIAQIKEQFALSFIQLHGTESPDFCESASRIAPVYKAFGLHGGFDFSSLDDYHGVVDLFVFDTSCKEHGGSGKKFDWKIINEYVGSTPFLLSGGISPDDIDSLQQIRHQCFAGIDLNSQFETDPGVKNVQLIQEFIGKVCFTVNL